MRGGRMSGPRGGVPLLTTSRRGLGRVKTRPHLGAVERSSPRVPTVATESGSSREQDPYNDFISEGGKLWSRIRAVAEANDCVPHTLGFLPFTRAPSEYISQIEALLRSPNSDHVCFRHVNSNQRECSRNNGGCGLIHRCQISCRSKTAAINNCANCPGDGEITHHVVQGVLTALSAWPA